MQRKKVDGFAEHISGKVVGNEEFRQRIEFSRWRVDGEQLC